MVLKSTLNVDSAARPDRPLRWGMLGISDYLLRYAVPGLQGAAGCELTCIGVRDLDRARKKLGDTLPSVELLSPCESVLERPDLDIIYITLPNGLHVQWALAALRAGKHVLCEKPLARDPRGVSEVAMLAASAGLKVMEAYMYRFHPRWETALDLLEEGVIGMLRLVVVQYSYLDSNYSGVRFDPAMDGGVLRMVGCYPMDILCRCFGEQPLAVSALSRSAPSANIDITTSAIVEFPSGHGVTTASVEAYDAQIVRAFGTEGIVELDMPVNPTREEETQIRISGDDGTREITISAVDQFQREFESFAYSVRENAPVTVTTEQSIVTAALLDAAARSAAKGGCRVLLQPSA